MNPPRNAAVPSRLDGADETVPRCGAEAAEQVQQLYRRHSSALVRQLARRTGCQESARDLAQEAFVRLLRMTPAGFRAIERPDAFLRRVSANLLNDWGRSKAVAERVNAPPDSGVEGLLDQVAVLESRDTLRRLEEAVAKLKPRTREIFLAHRVEGYSYAEIAARTGLTVKGVEKQMSKAIAKVARVLDRT